MHSPSLALILNGLDGLVKAKLVAYYRALVV